MNLSYKHIILTHGEPISRKQWKAEKRMCWLNMAKTNSIINWFEYEKTWQTNFDEHMISEISKNSSLEWNSAFFHPSFCIDGIVLNSD